VTDSRTAIDGSVADHDKLRLLSVAYADAVDARDGEGLAALFVEDGELVVPKVPVDLSPVISRVGHDAIRRVPEGLSRFDRTFHQTSDHRYVVDGESASGDVRCVAHHLTAVASDGSTDGPRATDTVWYIRYRDTYRRSGQRWRFARRELHLQWVEEREVALLGPTMERGV
jgi:ketosteroid isomerase-like protein